MHVWLSKNNGLLRRGITLLLFQVKMELTGNSSSSCPQQNLSSNPGQQHNSKDSSNSDDPLAAIMNQTIFEGIIHTFFVFLRLMHKWDFDEILTPMHHIVCKPKIHYLLEQFVEPSII